MGEQTESKIEQEIAFYKVCVDFSRAEFLHRLAMAREKRRYQYGAKEIIKKGFFDLNYVVTKNFDIIISFRPHSEIRDNYPDAEFAGRIFTEENGIRISPFTGTSGLSDTPEDKMQLVSSCVSKYLKEELGFEAL